MYKKVEDGHKIHYVDIVSLYPTTMRYDRYPLSHPKTKIMNPAVFSHEWFGLIKCRILPPNRLYIPMLPVKVTQINSQYEKLLFPLCRTCSIQHNKSSCTHSSDLRALIGTWSTEEIKLAIEKGYKILDIYEVWDFDSTTDLFAKYIDNFMRLKLESSPHGNSNEEYAAEMKEKLGIELDLSKIKVNHVLRSISKLCMNSVNFYLSRRTLTLVLLIIEYLIFFSFCRSCMENLVSEMCLQ